eukprot:5289753-Pyramimonas_sp.AAC.1
MGALRAARFVDLWGAPRAMMSNGKLGAICRAITGGVAHAGTRVPAQVARSARVQEIREDRREGRGRGATRVGMARARVSPKASLDAVALANRTTALLANRCRAMIWRTGGGRPEHQVRHR